MRGELVIVGFLVIALAPPAWPVKRADGTTVWLQSAWPVRILQATLLIIYVTASGHNLQPRTISFKGAVQTLEAFQPLIATQGQRDRTRRQCIYQQMLDAVATHRVADRPDRFEPRLRKRRPKKYDSMLEPRNVIKRKMLKRVKDI